MKIISRTFHTFLYFFTPFLIYITLLLATREYGSWERFFGSFLDFWSVVLTILAATSFWKVGKVLNGIRMYKKLVNFIDENKYMIVFDGFPGSGKTSTTSEYCVILATLYWEKICFDYWLLRNTKDKWQGNKKSELDFKDNEASYNLWRAQKNFFPCLYSNIDNYDIDNYAESGMTVGNKSVSYFSKGMLAQFAPIPYGSVIHLEEIGDWVGNEWSSNKKDEAMQGVSKNSRYCRHYGFNYVINDQDCQNIFINVRRSVAQNQLLLRQKWTCKANFLVGLLGFIKWCVRFFNYKNNRFLANFCRKLQKRINKIGFRRYWSIIGGNTQTGAGEERGNKFNYCIPSTLLATYDDRYKRTQYNPGPSTE